MKQENNHEFDEKKFLDTELIYEQNHTVKEEENFDEIVNGFEFMETVLVEVKQEHGQEISYFCDQCEFTSKHQKYLGVHMRSAHQGINFKCEKCSYVAQRPYQLKVHVESVHLGVRYKCEDCEYTATTKPNFRTHRNSQHLI